MSCDEKMCCFHLFIDQALRKHRRSDIHLKCGSNHVLEPVPVPLCPCAPRPPVPAALFCESKSRSLGFRLKVSLRTFVRWGRLKVVSSSRCLLSCLFSRLKNSKPNLFWSKFWSMILLWLSVQTVQILSNHQIINSSFIVHHVLCRSAMRFQS